MSFDKHTHPCGLPHHNQAIELPKPSLCPFQSTPHSSASNHWSAFDHCRLDLRFSRVSWKRVQGSVSPLSSPLPNVLPLGQCQSKKGPRPDPSCLQEESEAPDLRAVSPEGALETGDSSPGCGLPLLGLLPHSPRSQVAPRFWLDEQRQTVSYEPPF